MVAEEDMAGASDLILAIVGVIGRAFPPKDGIGK